MVEDTNIRNEVNWSRNHALAWAAKQEEIDEEEADEFAEFFKEAWLTHLKDNEKQVDQAMRQLLRQFRKEKAGGNRS